MSDFILYAPAKINLGLEILGKRADGYHNLKTIFCSVSLYDEIKITRLPHFSRLQRNSRGKQDDKIIVACEDRMVPTDERNSAYKALKLLGMGAMVSIKKEIPVKSGLGGGSGDGAAVLKVLGKDREDLMEMGLEIGSDVPYQIAGGTKIGEGRGEILSELPSLAGLNLVICVPNRGVETKWAFQNVNYSKINSGKIERLVMAVKNRDIFEIARNLHNDFEDWVLPKYPEIGDVKKNMLKYGAMGALMTGSGSGVFGIFENENKAKFAYEEMRKIYKKTFLVKVL